MLEEDDILSEIQPARMSAHGLGMFTAILADRRRLVHWLKITPRYSIRKILFALAERGEDGRAAVKEFLLTPGVLKRALKWGGDCGWVWYFLNNYSQEERVALLTRPRVMRVWDDTENMEPVWAFVRTLSEEEQKAIFREPYVFVNLAMGCSESRVETCEHVQNLGGLVERCVDEGGARGVRFIELDDEDHFSAKDPAKMRRASNRASPRRRSASRAARSSLRGHPAQFSRLRPRERRRLLALAVPRGNGARS